MQVLRTADEAHAGEAKAVRIQRILGRRDDVGMVGQAKIVVGAEVQHLATIAGADRRRLWRGDNAFGLVQALLAYRIKLGQQAVTGRVGHGSAVLGKDGDLNAAP